MPKQTESLLLGVTVEINLNMKTKTENVSLLLRVRIAVPDPGRDSNHFSAYAPLRPRRAPSSTETNTAAAIASKRKGNDFRGFQDFYVKIKARTGP